MNRASAAAERRAASVVRPTLLSHGTLMCRDLARTRRFYEEFLGLEVVRHARPAMMLRLRTGMYVVCVCIGERVPNQHVLTHWGLNVASREEVDQAHAAAHRDKEEYGIQKVMAVRERHGAYGFYFQDLDNNWWEIQYEPRAIDDFFDRGDVADMSVVATDSAESHE
jgi:catechol 2,3-dioxygenase-like lactoylglutathione lyase family enzyme